MAEIDKHWLALAYGTVISSRTYTMGLETLAG